MILVGETKPQCLDEWDLFYGTPDEDGNDDGRAEEGREEREAMAAILCAGCPYRLKCLEEALVTRQEYGVWGAMGEGERRKFRQHLIEEGYRRYEIPEGRELYAAVKSFYHYMETPQERLHLQMKSA